MGMTIWVNYLQDGQVTSDEADKSAMYRHLSKLDKVCGRLGLRKLSEFLDTLDLEASIGDAPLEGDNTWDLMAKKSQWFDPGEGIGVLQPLIDELEKQPVRFGLLSDQYAWVLEDLKQCRGSVEKAAADGARFHLCVVA